MEVIIDKYGKEISKKEFIRRQKIKKYFEKKRKAGYERYLKRIRKERIKREALEKKKKEKEREKKRKAKERAREKAKKKRKVGRPKKCGPKINFYKRRKKKLAKLNKVRVSRKLPPFIYKIISCRNGKQRKLIGKYRTSEDAFEMLEKLKKQNDNIVFPIEMTGENNLRIVLNEYILIEKSEDENLFMRNEYGKLIEQKTDIEGWRIIDKFQFKEEEAFSVFGFSSRDRKTFTWIYENIIAININNPFVFKRILVFRNKVIIKHDNGLIDIIFCKHPNDAVRFYNLTEAWVKKDKIKQIIFLGDYSERSPKRRVLEDELMDYTGWSRKKINMNGTSYFNKN